MKKYLSKSQFFETYLLLSPLGRKYWQSDALMLEFERKGYGFRENTGFTFTQYAPKHRHIADLAEIPTLKDYIETHRIGPKYTVISLVKTIIIAAMCLYLSYFMAQKTYEIKHRRSLINHRR